MSEPRTPGSRRRPETPAAAGGTAEPSDPARRNAPAGEGGSGGDATGQQHPEQTLLEQMGGISGMAYSAVPIVVFVLVNAMVDLVPAIWSSIGAAVLIAVVRLVRREPVQPAISGVLGVALCSFIAYRSGDAKNFFLFGIWTNLVYGGAFLISILVRWPLLGVAWSVLNRTGFAWRENRRALLAYDIATLAWTLVFAAKFVVQQWLYVADETGWLAFARIAMGYPLAGLALLVSVWAVRRVGKIAESADDPAVTGPGMPPGERAPRTNPSS